MRVSVCLDVSAVDQRSLRALTANWIILNRPKSTAFHVTLFSANVTCASQLSDELGRLAPQQKRLCVNYQRMAVLGGHTVCAVIESTTPLRALQISIFASLSKLVSPDRDYYQANTWHPHISLGTAAQNDMAAADAMCAIDLSLSGSRFALEAMTLKELPTERRIARWNAAASRA